VAAAMALPRRVDVAGVAAGRYEPTWPAGRALGAVSRECRVSVPRWTVLYTQATGIRRVPHSRTSTVSMATVRVWVVLVCLSVSLTHSRLDSRLCEVTVTVTALK
jgi:hypothetical protein